MKSKSYPLISRKISNWRFLIISILLLISLLFSACGVSSSQQKDQPAGGEALSTGGVNMESAVPAESAMPAVTPAGSEKPDVSGWSPDGNWLVCSNQYRYGSTLQFININTQETIDLGDNVLDSLVSDLPLLGLNATRGFSDLKLLQWSPESDRVLLSYTYSDVTMADASILMVNEFQRNSVDWVTSLSPDEQYSPESVDMTTGTPLIPTGFDWSAPGYGLPGVYIEFLEEN